MDQKTQIGMGQCLPSPLKTYAFSLLDMLESGEMVEQILVGKAEIPSGLHLKKKRCVVLRSLRHYLQA